MPPIPSKQDLLAAIASALGGMLAEVGAILDRSPDAEAAKQRVVAYVTGKLAPEVVAMLADGAIQEFVALLVTGQSEISKPPANLA